MTKWKWALAFRLPVKVLVVNENGDFFWFDREQLADHPALRAVARRPRRAATRCAPSAGSWSFRSLWLSAALRSGDPSPQKGSRMKAIQVHEPGGPGAA